MNGYDYAEAEIRVSDKTELIDKKRCSSQSKGCDGSGLGMDIDSRDGITDGGSVVISGKVVSSSNLTHAVTG